MAGVAMTLGIPETPTQVGIALLCVWGVALLGWIALPWLIPGARRADSHWRAPLSNAAGKRIMGSALRAPFYLAAIFLAIVVAFGYFRGTA